MLDTFPSSPSIPQLDIPVMPQRQSIPEGEPQTSIDPFTRGQNEETRTAHIRATTAGTALNFEPQTRFTEQDTRLEFVTPMLLDSGCTRSTIDTDYVQTHELHTQLLAAPYTVFNADGSPNGRVSEYILLEMEVMD